MSVSDLIGRWNKKLSKEEYIKEQFPDEGWGDGPIVKKLVTVNGLEMLRVEQAASETSYNTLQYLFFKNDKVYSFYLYPYQPTGDPILAKNYEDFQKLLYTFKFTK